MADLSAQKIATFTGINDTPVEPTATKAGNGSHLIKKYNDLVNQLADLITANEGDIADLNTTFISIPSTENLYPTSYTHWHTDRIVVNGSSLTTLTFADQPYGTVAKQNPSAYYDQFKFSALLKAGSYNMKITARTSTDGGYFLVYLDSYTTSLTSSGLDLYSATPAPKYFDVPFTLGASGLYTFLFRQQSGATGRNALNLTRMRIEPV